MAKVRNFIVLPALPDSLRDLELIARNMYWCWNPEIEELFHRIDSKLWHSCGNNPVKLLGMVSQQRLESLAKNNQYLRKVGLYVRPKAFSNLAGG